MTIDEFLCAMTVIDAGHDGTVESAARARHLYNTLLKEPDKFWEQWASSLDDMYVKRAEQSLYELTGQIVAVPNFAESRELIRARAPRQKGGHAGE